MENPAASQLPEVDSLPDGFVESPAESLAPIGPTFEQENPRVDHIEGSASELDSECEAFRTLETSCEAQSEKIQKIRTFPVELSDKDSFNSSGQSAAAVANGGCLEDIDGALGMLKPDGSFSGDPTRVASELSAASSNVKEKNEETHEGSVKCLTWGLDSQTVQPKEIPSSGSIESLKNKKEASEVKRKNAKRTMKQEKEFLEFTLKYQHVIAERDSAIAVRDKLESLCRELQRQNKMLRFECTRVSTEGKTLRSDLSTKFHDAIKEVSNRLEEQKVECLSQLKENEMLRSKLKELTDQYALSEQHFAQKLKQKSLELQIADLKILQHEEKLVQEQSQMKIYAEQVSQLLETEKNLRSQLTADEEKFQQFQDALSKRHEVFETFNMEIERTAKSIKELKKENTFLKSKCDKTDVTLVALVEEREHLKKQLEKSKSQKDKLESLCRSLQAERKQSWIPGERPVSDPSLSCDNV